MNVARLIEMGSRWQRNGMDRVYFNNLGYFYGIETTRYGSGKISSATLDGQPLSNNKAHELLVYLDGGKVWLDLTTNVFHWSGLDAEDGQFLVGAIKQAA